MTEKTGANENAQDLTGSRSTTSDNTDTDRIQQRIRDLEQELWYLKLQKEKQSSLEKTTSSTETKIEPSTFTASQSRSLSHEHQKIITPTFSASIQDQILMLTDAMPHMVWISDAEGHCTHANNRFYEYTGMTPGEDDGWGWVRVLHADDLKRTLELGNEASRNLNAFSTELRVRSALGAYQWHLLHSIPFLDKDTGAMKWYGTTTNIQAHKDTLEKVQNSEHQLSTLADAIPHMVFAAAKDGEIEFWNHRWVEYTGLEADQVSTDAWQLLIHPEDREKYMSEWRKALIEGYTFEIEFRLKRALGLKVSARDGYRWHLARAVAMRDAAGEVIKWFGTWTEIEAQKGSSPGTAINPDKKQEDRNQQQK